MHNPHDDSSNTNVVSSKFLAVLVVIVIYTQRYLIKISCFCLFRYVGNLDPAVTEDLLMALFGQIGQCKSCKIINEVSGLDDEASVLMGHDGP